MRHSHADRTGGRFRRNGPRQLTGLDEPTRLWSLSDPASAASSDSFSCKKGGIGPPFRLPGRQRIPSSLAGWMSGNNFFPPPGGAKPGLLFIPSPLVGEGRVGGVKAGHMVCPCLSIVSMAPRFGNADKQPAVPGRPIPLSFGKELGCGTRMRIGQGGDSVEMD
jgi:hypothetical protein